MSDNTNLRGPQDRTRVSMEEDYEVRYWTDRFGVAREELQRIVDAVGDSVLAIEQRLKNK